MHITWITYRSFKIGRLAMIHQHLIQLALLLFPKFSIHLDFGTINLHTIGRSSSTIMDTSVGDLNSISS